MYAVCKTIKYLRDHTSFLFETLISSTLVTAKLHSVILDVVPLNTKFSGRQSDSRLFFIWGVITLEACEKSAE